MRTCCRRSRSRNSSFQREAGLAGEVVEMLLHRQGQEGREPPRPVAQAAVLAQAGELGVAGIAIVFDRARSDLALQP
jgi:hypothetical protein